MALRFMDAVDFYKTSYLSSIYTVVGSPIITSDFGRFGGGVCIQLGPGAAGDAVSLNFDSRATWIVSFAYTQPYGAPQGGRKTSGVLQILDSATVQLALEITGGRKFRILRGTTVLATENLPSIIGNVWVFIEIKFTISNTVGAVEVRVNEVPIINLTDIDTQVSGNATADTFKFHLDVAGLKNLYEDICICDTSGGVHNDFLGTVLVQSRYPNGNGNSSNFVGQDADSINNYQNVDDRFQAFGDPDGDTTYNESSTVTDRDDYAVQNGNFRTDEIIAVSANAQARKDDGGTRDIDLYTRISSVDYDAGIDEPLTTSYARYQAIWENSPATSLPWTLVEYDATNFGIEVSA